MNRINRYICRDIEGNCTQNWLKTSLDITIFTKFECFMNKTTLEFVTYCIGKLAQVLHLPQNEVYRRLKRSGILYDYIVPSYDVLHTFSSRYLVEDLTEYMREKGELES